MNLEMQTPQVEKKKNTAVVIGAIIVVIGIIIASVMAYSQYRERESSKQQKQAETQAIVNQNRADDQQKIEAQREADISRLVSICMEAKERYNTLTAAQKAKEVEPDCTIHVQ